MINAVNFDNHLILELSDLNEDYCAVNSSGIASFFVCFFLPVYSKTHPT